MDKVRKIELDEFWGGDIHTAKLDAIIKKGNK